MARFRQAPSPASAPLTLQTDNALVTIDRSATPPILVRSFTVKGNALGTNGILVIDSATQNTGTVFTEFKITFGGVVISDQQKTDYLFTRLFIFNRNSAKSQYVVEETIRNLITNARGIPIVKTLTATIDTTVDQLLQMSATAIGSGSSYGLWWDVRLVRP